MSDRRRRFDLRARAVAAFTLAGALAFAACKREKQVPFGLPNTDEPTDQPVTPAPGDTQPPDTDSPSATQFEPGQTELTLGDKALVLQDGVLLAALPLDLDEDNTLEAIVVSTSEGTVTLHRAKQSLSSIVLRKLGSFSVPSDCEDATATVAAISDGLLQASVFHACAAGPRENHWIVSREVTPRVHERLTLLPGSTTDPAIAMTFDVADHDSDSLQDLIVRFTIDANDIQLVWLDRASGLSRDTTEPEASFARVAGAAREALAARPSNAEQQASMVLTAFEVLCRESGMARLGTSGTHGVQCGTSRSVGLAAAVVAQALIAQGRFVEALNASEWLVRPGVEVDTTLTKSLAAAWQGARSPASLTWRTLDNESEPAELSFRDAKTLVVRGSRPRTIDIATGSKTPVERSAVGAYAVHDTSNRFGVKRVTGGRCQQTRALVGAQPYEPPLSWSIGIDAPSPTDQKGCCKDGTCGREKDWWRVVGWAPQGLIAARGTRIRVVPLNKQLRAIGGWQDAGAAQPLPAPVFGAAITRDGGTHAIRTEHGVVIHRRRAGTSVWIGLLASGEVRSFAISPGGKALAVQQGSEIRLARW